MIAKGNHNDGHCAQIIEILKTRLQGFAILSEIYSRKYYRVEMGFGSKVL